MRLPRWAVVLLSVLAWAAALAAIEPIVHGYLTNPPDQRLVDLSVYRTGGLSVLQGQPLYRVLTQPPQAAAVHLPAASRDLRRPAGPAVVAGLPSWSGSLLSTCRSR